MIKPSDTSSDLRIGLALAIDEEIAAVGSAIQKVFIYNISVTPAKELTVLESPESTGEDGFGEYAVEINREYGILVGARHHTVGSML